jgi:2-oxoglutarate ferredoxin oxidoreductase subunit delta
LIYFKRKQAGKSRFCLPKSFRGGILKFWRKPLDLDKIKIPLGVIHILKERCKGCGFCIEYCPRGVLEESEEFNARGYHPPRIREGKELACVSCGLCEMLCPEFAIYNVEEMREVVSLWEEEAC